MYRLTFFLLASLLVFSRHSPLTAAAPASAVLEAGKVFTATDSLDCGKESNADAAACLEKLKWKCGAFQVTCQPPIQGRGDWLMRFPSPAPLGDEVNDLVAMEWYQARGADGKPMRAPAVVVVHESGRGMAAGRAIARGLCNRGFHAFLIHLPGYGERTSTITGDMTKALPALRQAVDDVRRARDAVSVLPFVDNSEIAVQGTSMGGFVVATVSGLDHGYDRYFILLAGGHIADVILNGKRDAAKMHDRLAEAGVTDEELRQVTNIIEPLRLAHRVDPARTWLFSGKYDEVVPPSSPAAFAKAASLGLDHHYILPVGHYTAALLLPILLPRVGELMTTKVAVLAK
jgi:dienelactone hydrolase